MRSPIGDRIAEENIRDFIKIAQSIPSLGSRFYNHSSIFSIANFLGSCALNVQIFSVFLRILLVP